MNILTPTQESFREFTEQHPDKNYELIHGDIVEMPSPHLLPIFLMNVRRCSRKNLSLQRTG